MIKKIPVIIAFITSCMALVALGIYMMNYGFSTLPFLLVLAELLLIRVCIHIIIN